VQALLIGIAISNNIGGMTTPIASPQNVIAFNWCGLAGSGMSFGGWLCITVPFCSILLLAAWCLIRLRYPPMLRVLQISELTREQPRMNRDQMLALLVTTSTVLAWAFWKPLGLEPYFGSMGLVGLVPIAFFFTAGLLDRNDFHNSLNWSVLILIGGGLALGHVMERSFLLQIMSTTIQRTLAGASLWTFTAAFSCFMAIIANFVSSTVAAIIILPVVASVGKSIGQANLMIIASVLMDSAASRAPPSPNAFRLCRALPRWIQRAPSVCRRAARANIVFRPQWRCLSRRFPTQIPSPCSARWQLWIKAQRKAMPRARRSPSLTSRALPMSIFISSPSPCSAYMAKAVSQSCLQLSDICGALLCACRRVGGSCAD